MNVGGFSEHQKKTRDADRYNGYFFTARFSQVKVSFMIRIFEPRSELQVAKCLIVYVRPVVVMSTSALSSERKTTQQWILRDASGTLLNQVRVYHESVCGQCRKHVLVCDVLFFSTLLQIHYQHKFRKCVPYPH